MLDDMLAESILRSNLASGDTVVVDAVDGQLTASTASWKFHGSLGTSRRSFVSPVKSPVGCAIVVGNKAQDALAQLRDRDATGMC